MEYLYGDSSPSPITIDYIGFLRQVIDAMVELMLAEQRIEKAAGGAARLEEDAAGRLEGIDEVGQAVRTALASWCRDPEDSAATRCAHAIERAATAEVKAQARAVRDELARAQREVVDSRTRELERCRRTLETLLAHYDLPDSRSEHRLEGGEGAYRVSRRDRASYGVELDLEVEIPEGTFLAGPARGSDLGLDRDLEIPDGAGLGRKLARKVPRKLAKLVLTDARLGGDGALVVLRAGPGAEDAGLELAIDAAGRVEVTPIGVAELEGVCFAAADADAAAIAGVAERLRREIDEIGRQAARVTALRIDDEPLGESKSPALLVERLVAAVAPVVADIAERSSSPTELVLRKSLGGGRREEIFVPKAELAAKLEELPRPMRQVFAALHLGRASEPSQELEVELVFSEDSAEALEPRSGEIEVIGEGEPAAEIQASPPPIPDAAREASDEADEAEREEPAPVS